MEKIVSDFINLQINIKYALSTVHTHDWYEIKSKSEYALFIMQDGIMHLSYQQQSYTLQPGDAFLFYPQIPYHASTTSDCCRFIFIHLTVIIRQHIFTMRLDKFAPVFFPCKKKNRLLNYS